MRLFTFFGIPAAVSLALLVVSPAEAVDSWLTRVAYCAHLNMTAHKGLEGKSMTMEGKVCETAKGRKTWREMTSPLGGKTVMITNGGKSWILDPERKTYWESHGSGKKDPETMIREGKVKITPLGWETINGIKVQKLNIEGVDKRGRRFVVNRWVTKDNVPVRMEGKDFRIDYTNIKIGRQNPRLFELPPGYQRMALPGIPGRPPTGLRGRGEMPQGPPPGMSKKQWEEMKKTIEQMQRQQGGKY